MITFNNIDKDLPYLQDAKEACDIIDKERGVAEKFFSDAYDGVKTNIEDIDKTIDFIGIYLNAPGMESAFDILLNKDFFKNWKGFKVQLKSLINAIKNITSLATKVDNFFSIHFDSWLDENYWTDLIKKLSEALDNPEALNQWINLNRWYARAKADGSIGKQLLTI
ncbi:hypothetical protein CAXC1_110009 [Candidatus Xenohaliotis californiensis]|uniref:Uncharacterized protein n=1 Tax=Candidatus Xenohaliotis californiensis TaxID=84677 RepID=A0ABP0EUP8_9RICK|nr:hypothetical protein CAXC1_110009 [Candidatus Xenohaliotis californiensis]